MPSFSSMRRNLPSKYPWILVQPIAVDVFEGRQELSAQSAMIGVTQYFHAPNRLNQSDVIPGEEPTYAGVNMTDIISNNKGLGDVIGLLWFKRRLPSYASKFIEMCLILVADHGNKAPRGWRSFCY